MIDTKLLPVPLEYSCPIVMRVKLPRRNDSGRLNYYTYVPELGTWVLEKMRNSVFKKLQKLNITFRDWENRWLLKLQPSDMYSELWVDKIIEVYYKDKLPNTKSYIKDQLLLDNDYVFTGVMVKEDLMDIFIKSREGSFIDIVYNYDLVPKIIEKLTDEICLQYLNDNNEYEKYYTTYSDFISRGLNCRYYAAKLRKITLSNKEYHSSRLKTTETYITESKAKFGENSFEYLSEYTGRIDKMTFKCNKCGTTFSVLAKTHLESSHGGCPVCNTNSKKEDRKFSNQDFQNRLDNIYGIGKYKLISNFINCKTTVEILDLETNTIFKQDPENLLYHGLTDPSTVTKSKGERLVELWINKNSDKILDYKWNTKVSGIEGRCRDYVMIDFIINYGGKTIWIEYNGIQHYTYFSLYHKYDKNLFDDQKRRDENVRIYCKQNNIMLVEIPYTISSFKRVSEFLNKVVFENIDPSTLVDYNLLYETTKGK